MKKELKQMLHILRHWRRTYYIGRCPEYAKERETAEIIRLVHSVEKGLSLECPRLGFGAGKILELLDRCECYEKEYGSGNLCLLMAHDAVAEYIDFHKQAQYVHEDFTAVCNRFNTITWNHTEGKFGGTLQIDTRARTLDFEELTAFLLSRHSVRDFAPGEVAEEELFEAVKLAQSAPSACNRQAARAYILSAAKLKEVSKDSLEGMGGFADAADKFILITGKVSAYRMNEYDQHIVSASIFATYLMLALHARNVGVCVVQRPLQYSRSWKHIQEKCKIPGDEQLVLMLAVGRNKTVYTAPVSGRYATEDICKVIR